MSRQTPVNQPVEPAAPIVPDVVVKPSTQETALALLQAMRPQQWTKNGLVFAALVFDRKFTDFSTVMVSILAAICFCAASSTIYLINDVRDIERDQLHPRKRYRPIASGRITPRQALIAAAVLEIFSITIAVLISPAFALIILGYLVLMVAYTLELKQLAIIDVFAIAAGFVLRAAGGAIAIDVPVSPWLYACTMLLALLIGFGKRRSELASLGGNAIAHRPSLGEYTLVLLDQYLSILAAATVIAYSLYTFDAAAVPRNHAMMLTIPFVVYAILRYLYLVHRSELGGTPEALLFADKPLLISIIGWGMASAIIILLTK